MNTSAEQTEEQRIKKVRNERSNRLSKSPLAKFRRLYRFAEDFLEYAPEEKARFKELINQVEQEDLKDIQQAEHRARESERNKIEVRVTNGISSWESEDIAYVSQLIQGEEAK